MTDTPSPDMPASDTGRPLDALIGALDDSDIAWTRFGDAFALTEIVVLMTDEADEADDAGDADPVPRTLDISGGPVALGFDGMERLAAFIDKPSETMSARGADVARLLGGLGLRLALNPGTDGAETVLEPAQLAWIADRHAAPVVAEDAERIAIGPPGTVAPGLLAALSTRLTAMSGVLSEAWLTGTEGGDLILIVLPGAGMPDTVIENAIDLLTRTGQAESARRFATAPVTRGSDALAVAKRAGIGLLHAGTLTPAIGR